METSIDFGELSGDENLKNKFISFRKAVEASSKMMETFFNKFKYNELSVEDKVRYDLFLAFAINSYFWMYLRVRGIDPNQHEIKSQINRVREYMNKSKEIHDKKTMARVDQNAAKRFVKSGLWTPKASGSSTETETRMKTSLKRKREESDNEED